MAKSGVQQHNFSRPGGFAGTGWAVALMVLLTDQISKWAIVETLFRPDGWRGLSFAQWYVENRPPYPYDSLEILPVFNLVLVYNSGVSFSLFSDHGDLAHYMPLILAGIATLIALGFAIWLTKTDRKWEAFGAGLVIGGAIGNVLDRLRFGAVIDFLDLHIGDLHWPAFNVADCGVVIGVAVILLYRLRTGRI